MIYLDREPAAAPLRSNPGFFEPFSPAKHDEKVSDIARHSAASRGSRCLRHSLRCKSPILCLSRKEKNRCSRQPAARYR